MLFDFAKTTKSYDLYVQRGGFNKLYLPKVGTPRPSITVEVV